MVQSNSCIKLTGRALLLVHTDCTHEADQTLKKWPKYVVVGRGPPSPLLGTICDLARKWIFPPDIRQRDDKRRF
jgi:hypothetical protein